MGKYIKPGSLVDLETVDTKILESIKPRFSQSTRFLCTNKLTKMDLDIIATYYKDMDVIRLDLKEFESLTKLQEILIQEIHEAYPFKRMDQYTYLDETMEQLDHSYNMKWVFILENWDCMDSDTYIRFLNNIFKNGILSFGLKLVILTGNEDIRTLGFSKFTTL